MFKRGLLLILVVTVLASPLRRNERRLFSLVNALKLGGLYQSVAVIKDTSTSTAFSIGGTFDSVTNYYAKTKKCLNLCSGFTNVPCLMLFGCTSQLITTAVILGVALLVILLAVLISCSRDGCSCKCLLNWLLILTGVKLVWCLCKTMCRCCCKRRK